MFPDSILDWYRYCKSVSGVFFFFSKKCFHAHFTQKTYFFLNFDLSLVLNSTIGEPTPLWEWIWSRRIVIMGIAESPASLLPHTLAPKFVSRWNVKLFFPPLPTNTSSYSYLLHHPHHNIIIVKTSLGETHCTTGPILLARKLLKKDAKKTTAS